MIWFIFFFLFCLGAMIGFAMWVTPTEPTEPPDWFDDDSEL